MAEEAGYAAITCGKASESDVEAAEEHIAPPATDEEICLMKLYCELEQIGLEEYYNMTEEPEYAVVTGRKASEPDVSATEEQPRLVEADEVTLLTLMRVFEDSIVPRQDGLGEMVDRILAQMELHPGIVKTNGRVGYLRSIEQEAEFYISGLTYLNIARDRNKKVKLRRKGMNIEIACPLIIRDLLIEFKTPLLYCAVPLCERGVLKVGMTRIKLKFSIHHWKARCDFIRVTSMKFYKVEKYDSLNIFQRWALKQKLFSLKREYKVFIKEAISLYLRHILNKYLRVYVFSLDMFPKIFGI